MREAFLIPTFLLRDLIAQERSIEKEINTTRARREGGGEESCLLLQYAYVCFPRFAEQLNDVMLKFDRMK